MLVLMWYTAVNSLLHFCHKTYRAVCKDEVGNSSITPRSILGHLNIPDLNPLIVRQWPSQDCVVQCLVAESKDLRPEEQQALYFLRQVILGLQLDELQQFLHFVTGSIDMPCNGIKVSFMATGYSFVAHTSSNILEVPVAFQSLQEF